MMLRRFMPAFMGLLFLHLLPTAFIGCAGKAVDEGDPASLFSDAEEEIKSDHYQIAIEKLRVIKNKFPYSKFSLDAQLRIADVLYLQESFAEAAAAYETFRDLHPKHEKVAYAMFRAGKAYFNDIPSPISRDMIPAQKALDAYNEYLRRFPAEKDAEEARKDLAETRKALADKELYIGDFYFKRDFLESAKPRYQKVVALYPETDAAKKAQSKITKIDEEFSKHPEKVMNQGKKGPDDK